MKTLEYQKESISLFFREQFHHSLEREGFTYIRFQGDRWLRTVDNTVLLSVHLQPVCRTFEVYYGYQPLFLPLGFPTEIVDYLKYKRLLFNADTEYRQKQGGVLPYLTNPLKNAETRRQAASYWQQVLETAVFPVLRPIRNEASCHAVYSQRREQKNAWGPDRFDDRYLMECVWLGYWEELERICQEQLLPMLRSNPQATVSMDCCGAEAGGTVGEMPAAQLLEDLQAGAPKLRSRMTATAARSKTKLQLLGLL